MAETLNRCPAEINLCLTRGDTQAFGFALLDDDGTPSDLTGKSYLFTVDTNPNPTDALSNLYSVAGVVNGNVVSINLSPAEADQLGVLFYDLEETDGSGGVFTVAKGEVEWKQDITK